MDPTFRRSVRAAPTDRTVMITFVALVVSLAAMFVSALWLVISSLGALLKHLQS